MIGGLITIIVLIVIRVPTVFRTVEDPLRLPDRISLPAGATATAFTRGHDWFAVVTDRDEILIFDARDGALRQKIAIAPAK